MDFYLFLIDLYLLRRGPQAANLTVTVFVFMFFLKKYHSMNNETWSSDSDQKKMKRSCEDEDDGSSHRDGSDCRKKVQSDAEVGRFSFDSNEPESSPNCSNERLQIRSRYRELIAIMQSECLAGKASLLIEKDFVTHHCQCCFPVVILENREDMLNPSNNALTDILKEANELFKDGMCGRFQSKKRVELVAVLVACCFF